MADRQQLGPKLEPKRRRRRLALAWRWLAMGLAMAGGLMLAPPARADFVAGVRAYDAGDYATAYREWLPLAEDGDVAAMRNIGTLYRLGRGVKQDFAQAAHWYRGAAELGFSHAETNLGELYLTGEGVPQDAAEAARWFTRAANQGEGLAAFSLAALYESGRGVTQNEGTALFWYRRAAAAGYAPAQARLAALGPVMPPASSPPAPVAKPAPAPKPASMPIATPMPPPPPIDPHAGLAAYQAGNYQQALAEALPAARAGSAAAQYLLGELFRDGSGVPPDPARAQSWFILAARGGNEAAARAQAALSPQLSPAQQAKAQILLKTWRTGD